MGAERAPAIRAGSTESAESTPRGQEPPGEVLSQLDMRKKREAFIALILLRPRLGWLHIQRFGT